MLESYWTTGSLLFENAAICNIGNMLSSLQGLNYTTYKNITGFTFQGAIPTDLSGDGRYLESYNGNTSFLPMDGAGLSHLSTVPKYADLLGYPNANSWNFDANGLNFTCTSQLNITIANSWGPPWVR